MKSVVCAAALLMVMANPDRPRPDPTKEDAKVLQGTWHAKQVEQGGVARADVIGNCALVYEGDKFRVEFNGQVLQRGVVTRRDATKNPKEFDFEYTEGFLIGEKFIGIYKISEGTYTCCFVPAGEDRPKEFKSPMGSNMVLNVLKRE